MKTKSKTKQVTTNNWQLKNKETGKVYSNWTYPSRTAARKAAKGKRFKGMYVPTRSGDGGIDPKKLKKGKPAPTPKSVMSPVQEQEQFELSFFRDLIDYLFKSDTDEDQTINTETESNTTMSNTVRQGVNTKPKLRKANSAPGSKFHRHGTFGVK